MERRKGQSGPSHVHFLVLEGRFLGMKITKDSFKIFSMVSQARQGAKGPEALPSSFIEFVWLITVTLSFRRSCGRCDSVGSILMQNLSSCILFTAEDVD